MSEYLRWYASAIGLAALVAAVWIKCREDGEVQFPVVKAEPEPCPVSCLACLQSLPNSEGLGRETTSDEKEREGIESSLEEIVGRLLHEVFRRKGPDGSSSQISRANLADGLESIEGRPTLDEFTGPAVLGSDTSCCVSIGDLTELHSSTTSAQESGSELNKGLCYRSPATLYPTAQRCGAALNQGIAYDEVSRLRELLQIYHSPLIESE